MFFRACELNGVQLIELDPRHDERGFFARAYCRREFEEHNLNSKLVQCNLSFNPRRGTLRGMHYQIEPCAEVKLVRCLRGAIYDAIIDLRPDSPTYKRSMGVRLDDDNRRMLYVPEGFAHGYLSLTDNTEVFYQVSEFYAPGSERGIRFDDPAFHIEWPFQPEIISLKDRQYPAYRE